MTSETVTVEDRAAVVALARRLGMTEWPPSAGGLIAVGDAETFYELVRQADGIAFVETQRGRAEVNLVCESVADAVRFLEFFLSDRRPEPSAGFAPGCSYTAEGADGVLRWPGGQAVSPGRRIDAEQARAFSWVISR